MWERENVGCVAFLLTSAFSGQADFKTKRSDFLFGEPHELEPFNKNWALPLSLDFLRFVKC